MNRRDIVINLLITYGKYGVTKDVIDSAIDDGIKNYDMTLDGVYTGLRMSLAKVFNEQEYFTIEDVMSITGETREEVAERIQEMLKDVKATGENPDDYAVEINKENVQRFIIPSNFLS